MSRKTKEEAGKTRARIVASALSLFVRKGYEHTTFTDIAARLKMTKGAVYWHFETKEALLVALVDEMLVKFRRQLDELMPKDGLTYLAIVKTMVATAERIVADPKGSAFFMLLQKQIQWGADSMAKTREELLSGSVDGPYHAFIRALECDREAGRVRQDTEPRAVASVSMAIWDGLVKAKIEKFLECDLHETLCRAYAAIWDSIKAS